MKQIILITVAFLALFASGCGNMSPRQEPRIDDNTGQIQELENLNNALKAEIATLQSQAEIKDSQLEKLQQGLANLQNNNENSGVQIFSGSAGIISIVVIFIGACVIVALSRNQTKKAEQTSELLARGIVGMQNPELENSVFASALNTNVQENVLKVMKKYQG